MDPRDEDVRARIAVISFHTSPWDQPGTGDSGGMNVYVRAVAERLAARGVAVDVFTRCAGRGVPEVDRPARRLRIIQVPAGPCAPVDKAGLPSLVPAFSEAVVGHPAASPPYDLVHAHYWLSGSVARRARRRWGVPLVASFHTLGKVKNLALRESSEPSGRLEGETAIIREADRILAPTPSEAAHLEWLYGAPAARIRVVPPGVDAARFHPRPPGPARAALGLGGKRVALFVGRLQLLKGPDVAVRAVAEAVARDPGATRDLVLAVVGGPSGAEAIAARHLTELAARLGIPGRVRLFDPRPHGRLPEVYAAADVLLMPSRSESFGLVALEAQASGVPVVAAEVGGLRTVVADGRTGYLVPGHDPGPYAERLLAILRDDGARVRMGRGGVRHAARFPWEATAGRALDVYAELVPRISEAEEIPA
ncbi:MAG: glycosyltransferase [Actinomycetota bacterium]